MTAGRRTASIMDLNLAGTTGPAPKLSCYEKSCVDDDLRSDLSCTELI